MVKRTKKRSRGVEVYVEEKVSRTYKTSHGDPSKTSDEDLANPIEVDTRHYCKYCRRKRVERVMVTVGRAAFGKTSWACINKLECRAIADQKKEYKAAHG